MGKGIGRVKSGVERDPTALSAQINILNEIDSDKDKDKHDDAS